MLAALNTASDEGMTENVSWERDVKLSCDNPGDTFPYPTFEPLFVLF